MRVVVVVWDVRVAVRFATEEEKEADENGDGQNHADGDNDEGGDV